MTVADGGKHLLHPYVHQLLKAKRHVFRFEPRWLRLSPRSLLLVLLVAHLRAEGREHIDVEACAKKYGLWPAKANNNSRARFIATWAKELATEAPQSEAAQLMGELSTATTRRRRAPSGERHGSSQKADQAAAQAVQPSLQEQARSQNLKDYQDLSTVCGEEWEEGKGDTGSCWGAGCAEEHHLVCLRWQCTRTAGTVGGYSCVSVGVSNLLRPTHSRTPVCHLLA